MFALFPLCLYFQVECGKLSLMRLYPFHFILSSSTEETVKGTEGTVKRAVFTVSHKQAFLWYIISCPLWVSLFPG